MGAVLFLEFGEPRTLFKEVVKGLLAVGDGLLQQLRIDLFQPFETRPALKSGQFNGKLRSGDGFAGLLISLFSTLERPVKDEPARAGITSKRRLLFSGRINPEPVDLSFRHSISNAQQVDVFAKSRSWTGIVERSGATRCFAPRQIHPPAGSCWLKNGTPGNDSFVGLFETKPKTLGHFAPLLLALEPTKRPAFNSGIAGR